MFAQTVREKALLKLNFNAPTGQKIIAFDPGGTTGFALLQEGQVVRIGEVPHADLFPFLQETTKYLGSDDIVICEDYKIRPGKQNAHIWQSPLAYRVLGNIELWAFQLGARFEIQQPSIKPVGYARLNKKAGKGKGNHQYDALAHAVYYMMRHYGEKAN